MLIITRKLKQRIWISNVVLEVLEIRGDKVKLGFIGPDDVEIDREEVRERKIAARKKNKKVT